MSAPDAFEPSDETRSRWSRCRSGFLATPLLVAVYLAFLHRHDGVALVGWLTFFVVTWVVINLLVKAKDERRAAAQPAEVLAVTMAAVMIGELRKEEWSRAALATVRSNAGVGTFGRRVGGTLVVGRHSLTWAPSPISTRLGMPGFEVPLASVTRVEILPFALPNLDFAGVDVFFADGHRIGFLVRGRKRLRESLLRTELFDPNRQVDPTLPIVWRKAQAPKTVV